MSREDQEKFDRMLSEPSPEEVREAAAKAVARFRAQQAERAKAGKPRGRRLPPPEWLNP